MGRTAAYAHQRSFKKKMCSYSMIIHNKFSAQVMNTVARAPLPCPAMARIEECLLLEGVVPTDEFAQELHTNIGCGGFQLERVGDFAIYVIADVRRNQKEFVVRMIHGKDADAESMGEFYFWSARVTSSCCTPCAKSWRSPPDAATWRARRRTRRRTPR